MDMYAKLKELEARVAALEALGSVVEDWPDAETAREIDEAMTLAVEPMPFESSEDQARNEAQQEAEVDEAVEAALSPEVPYVGHVEPDEINLDDVLADDHFEPGASEADIFEDVNNTYADEEDFEPPTVDGEVI